VDLKKRPEALKDVASALGGMQIEFFGHVKGHYGNALLSSYPVRRRHDFALEGGTEVIHQGSTYRIHRGMLVCSLELPGNEDLSIACTHLDHIKEVERTTQVRLSIDARHRPHQLVVTHGAYS
jgi:endonuclease/exonuclease/phosphatase family metal-dependent hydrolase